MKTKQFIAIVAIAFAFCNGTAFGQPGPHIDPLTGMPATTTAGELTPTTAIQDASQMTEKVRSLIFNSRYDEALQMCLAYHEKYKTGSSWSYLLPDWVELGRRFPKAKEALIKIRDNDVREFSAGRGFADLFSEVYSINGALHQDDSTYELFKSFRDKDPDLAQQCYYYVEGLLMAKGDYQWCYNHIGDPQAKFDSIHQSMTMQLDNQKRLAAMNESTRQRMVEMNRQHGWTNMPAYSPPDTSAMLKQSAENGFVGQTRRLIEILVATGHKPEAEKIQGQALTVLDDERLKSAVADAETKTKKAI
jgi:hypothetical protein